jgi:hypothetical protein
MWVGGSQEEIFRLPAADVDAGLTLHEPRPLVPRARERVIPDRLDPTAATDQPSGAGAKGIQGT